MAATTWHTTPMEQLLNQLRSQFPTLIYREGASFCWSPETQEISYAPRSDETSETWSLLHETSHALLGHKRYQTDFELIKMEVAAWEKAKELAKDFGITIDDNHVQDCLDSYRDWIYARSICPECGNKSLQQADLRHYRCFNCHGLWSVTPSRFCRAYRATKRGINPPQAFDALIEL